MLLCFFSIPFSMLCSVLMHVIVHVHNHVRYVQGVEQKDRGFNVMILYVNMYIYTYVVCK